MAYRPNPVDTRSVELDPSLVGLVEQLAANTHEVWARTRMEDDWVWGPQRNDATKQHPSLIEYEALSDAEKQLDRNTAMETLRFITKLGYRIQPPLLSGLAGAAMQVIDLTLVALATPARLAELWTTLQADPRSHPVEVYIQFAHRAISLAEYLLAYDATETGLNRYPGNPRLRQQQALSLARNGASDAARMQFEKLRDEGHFDEEALGGLGRSYKDLWERATHPVEAQAWLIKACNTYEQAWQQTQGCWTAINAATLAACLGDAERSAAAARFAKEHSLRDLETAKPGAASYWPLATMGEAALVLGDLSQAERYYRLAMNEAGDRFGDISSTRRNALLLLRHLGHGNDAQSLINQWLPMQRVVVFSGHMIDADNRPMPRFPATLEHAVAAAIDEKLRTLDAGIGYSSAACGSDLLFLEAMLRLRKQVNIVLPYEADHFMRNSVSRGGPEWEKRYHRALTSPGVQVFTVSQGTIQGDSVMNAYANLFTFGMAGMQALKLGTKLTPLAVWDDKAGDGPGGTAHAVETWRRHGCREELINPLKLGGFASEVISVRDDASAANSPAETSPQLDGQMEARMVAMLFADVVGFSKLTEEEIPLFVEHFMKPATALAAMPGRRPLQLNTWGDGLYFVLETVEDAGRLALDLRDMVVQTDWIQLGFRAPLQLRTGLHAGPAHAYMNPATGRRDFIGTHVSRAARIEPVTPPGQVYASEAFAAIAFAERAKGFRCEYVGLICLPKGYGTYRTYHIHRIASQDSPG